MHQGEGIKNTEFYSLIHVSYIVLDQWKGRILPLGTHSEVMTGTNLASCQVHMLQLCPEALFLLIVISFSASNQDS